MWRSVITDADIPKTLKGQLELFAEHGVFVTPTGAALTNVMFLVPFSSVIEIFPPLLDHNIGPVMSTLAGLGYYPVHTHNATSVYSQSKVSLRVFL